MTQRVFDLGNAYYKLGRLPDAITQYNKAMIGNKDFWPAINNIGLIKYEQGDVEAALKHKQRSRSTSRQQNLRWQWRWRCIPKATANRV